MVARKVLKQEAEFAEGFDGDEVGVIDDGDDVFAFAVKGASFGDEPSFAFVVGAVGFEVEGLA